MDRSEEFLRVAEIFVPESAVKSEENALQLGPKKPFRFSEFLQTVLITYNVILENEELVKRMARLASMKEFSGDPTANMQELSVQFEMKIKYLQNSLQKLKIMSDKGTLSSHDSQHRQLITQYLSKIISNHVQNFKQSLKEHAKNVDERNKRVQKYGNISSASQSSLLADSTHTSKYAMFSNLSINDNAPLVHIEKSHALRNRRPGQASTNNVSATTHSSNSHENETPFSANGEHDDDEKEKSKGKSFTRYEPPRTSLFQQHVVKQTQSGKGSSPYAMHINSPYNSSQQQQQAQAQAAKPITTESRFRHAERVEASIREMGQLFSQMASMIAEQSEVITRIEDDVEVGHQNTMDGYASLQTAYDITKGNRGMIIKIFLILIFCIFLFLVWT